MEGTCYHCGSGTSKLKLVDIGGSAGEQKVCHECRAGTAEKEEGGECE